MVGSLSHILACSSSLKELNTSPLRILANKAFLSNVDARGAVGSKALRADLENVSNGSAVEALWALGALGA